MYGLDCDYAYCQPVIDDRLPQDSRKTINAPRDPISGDFMRYKLWQTNIFINATGEQSSNSGITHLTEGAILHLQLFDVAVEQILRFVRDKLKTLLVATRRNSPLLADKLESSMLRIEVIGYSELVLRARYTDEELINKPKTTSSPRRDDLMEKGMLIRCHPNYQKEGPWNDWVLIYSDLLLSTNATKSTTGDKTVLDGFPGKVHALYEITLKPLDSSSNVIDGYELIRDYDRNYVNDFNQLFLLVHPTKKYIHGSVLTETWLLDYDVTNDNEDERVNIFTPKWRMISTEDVCGRAACFTSVPFIIDSFKENNDERNERSHVVVLLDRETKWSSLFLE
jgi:hypothetical protein